MTKQTNPADLSEYAEEKIPFDAVIKRLGRAAAPAPQTPKPKSKPKKRAKRAA